MVTWARTQSARLYRALFLVAVCLALPTCGDSPPSIRQIGAFQYAPFPGLSGEERAVEDRFAQSIGHNLRVFVSAYRWRYGKVVNTDNARELSPDYAPDGFDLLTERNRDRRTRNTLATQGPSRALAVEVYRQMLLEQPRAGQESRVIFTAGGAGSGKSTSIQTLPALQGMVERAQIVFDTTLSSREASDHVGEAFRAGKSVTIIYVYREPPDAFRGMIARARATGRPVSVSNFLSTHLGAPTILGEITRRFAPYIRSGRLEVYVVNNTGSPESAAVVSNPFQFLASRTTRYARNRLETHLRRDLETAYRNGQIDRVMFNEIERKLSGRGDKILSNSNEFGGSTWPNAIHTEACLPTPSG